jgi:hypothetical protein
MTNDTEERREITGGNSAPIWGIFLLFLGVVLLLQTFGVLPWNLWGTLWRFWPALIIIIGLNIVFRRTNPLLVSLLVVFLLGACPGLAIPQHDSGASIETTDTIGYIQPVDGIREAEIDIDFSAGSLNLAGLAGNSPNLVEADAETRNDTSSLGTDFYQSGDTAYFTFSAINQQYWPGDGIDWEMDFSPEVPLTFNIKAAAGSLSLDFSELELSELNLDLNAGRCNIELPSPDGTLPVTIKANVTSVDITIPDGAAARIQLSTNIGTTDISDRFIETGNDYFTPDYGDAAHRIDLVIESNVGRVAIN